MSGVEWTTLKRTGSPDYEREWRRYCAHIGDNPDSVRLKRERRLDEWGWYAVCRETGYQVQLPGNDLPDSEAQRLAVPTLVAALRQVLERLEGAADV